MSTEIDFLNMDFDDYMKYEEIRYKIYKAPPRDYLKERHSTEQCSTEEACEIKEDFLNEPFYKYSIPAVIELPGGGAVTLNLDIDTYYAWREGVDMREIDLSYNTKLFRDLADGFRDYITNLGNKYNSRPKTEESGNQEE